MGVLQGSILSPALFSIKINNIVKAVLQGTKGDGGSSWQHPIQCWGMRFNAKKCQILSIKSRSSSFYSLSDTILKHVPSNTYLGTLFSEDMKWSPLISNITKKGNCSLGLLRRNLCHCPTQCKRNVYLALVQPVLEYGAAVWDTYLQGDINRIERIQRRAAR